MNILKSSAFAIITALPLSASACDLTISPGENIQFALNNPSATQICLRPGIYRTTSQINIPDNKKLVGIGANRDDVRIISKAGRTISMGSKTLIKSLRIESEPGSLPTFGILVYKKNDVTIWGVRVMSNKINIGVSGSTDIKVWDTFMSMNGIRDSTADPNMWITDSNNVTILWGSAHGRGDRPFGDGEIAAYNSKNVKINGTHVIDSGTSAIYFVNCDYCSVENATLIRAGGWGLDIVGGSDWFVAKNNKIHQSWFSGSVFDKNNLSGQYINNEFRGNNKSGNQKFCNGVSHRDSPNNFYFSGNQGENPLLCKSWP